MQEKAKNHKEENNQMHMRKYNIEREGNRIQMVMMKKA